jgi:hypothetical protein
MNETYNKKIFTQNIKDLPKGITYDFDNDRFVATYSNKKQNIKRERFYSKSLFLCVEWRDDMLLTYGETCSGSITH